MNALKLSTVLGTCCALAVFAAVAAPARAANAAPGWTTHRDPAGFSIDVPRGWTVNADPASGRIGVTGSGGESLVVWPVFVSARLGPSSAAAILQQFTTKNLKGVNWSAPQKLGSGSVRMRGEAGGRYDLSAFSWVVSPKGSAGYYYLVSAPKATFQRSEATFASILHSVRLVGSPQPQAAAAGSLGSVRFVRWSDPRENAFSLDVPAGWNASGGMFRFASIDVRPELRVVSPDHSIWIGGGDKKLSAFVVPTQLTLASGLREGMSYSPQGVTYTVLHYLPGASAAETYVSRLGAAEAGCTNVSFTSTKDDTVALRQLAAQLGISIAPFVGSGGEVTFDCTRAGRPMKGYYYADTAYSAGFWLIGHLYGFVATPEKAALATAILKHMVSTTRANMQWQAAQSNTAAKVSQINAQAQEHISNTIMQGYESRQATLDDLSRKRSNEMLGVEDVRDPSTGQNYRVSSGANYNWVDNRGNVVGTSTYTSPGVDFRALTKW